MRRYWVNKDNFVQSDIGLQVILKGEDFRHICIVCRQDVGAKFEVLSEDTAYFVEIIDKSKKQAVAKVHSEREIPPIGRPKIELCISLPKFKKFEFILEKSVELGVYRIRPFFSEFSFVTKLSKISEERELRWQKIVKSATQQTGRGRLMVVDSPCPLGELLDNFNQEHGAVGLFPYEGECDKTFKTQLKELKSTQFDSVWAFVGSEGGFSSAEVNQFSKNNLSPITLGEQVLRVETACLSVASILKYELVDN